MLQAVGWWATFEALGLLALPLCTLLFRPLPDRGYTLSKVVGLALVSWLAWMASFSSAAPFGPGLVRACALAVAAASLAVMVLHRDSRPPALLSFLRGRWAYVLAFEAVFAAAYGAIVLLRCYMPDISATEKPMEYMLLQTMYHVRHMPPQDYWMSGEPVNYYYFGYLMNALVGLLSGVEPRYAFNLAIASTWAMTLVALSGTAYNAASLATDSRRARVGAAVLAPVLVLLIGNVKGTLMVWQYVRQGAPFDFSLFWDPSRVIHDRFPNVKQPVEVIDEFPAFSYLLGDMHPHLMAMPLFALGIATSLLVAVSRRLGTVRALGSTALGGTVVGLLYITNTWDAPAIAAVILCGALIGAGGARHATRGPDGTSGDASPSARTCLGQGALALVPIVVLAVGFALPFLRTYHTPVDPTSPLPSRIASIPVLSGLGHTLGVVWWDHTDPGEFLGMWGVQALVSALALVVCARRLSRPAWLSVGLVALVSAVVALLIGSPLLMLVPVALTCFLLAFSDLPLGVRWALLLEAAAWGLVVLPELVYLRDPFDNRMNTVFKFYFQAWQLLGVACAVLVVTAVSRITLSKRRVPVAVPALALVLIASLSYPYGGIMARANGGFQGLDGVRFLYAEDTGAYQAVRWLDEHSSPGDVVFEAVGGDYTLYARVSTYAGRPTVMGWPGHEWQWRFGELALRDEIGERTQDIRTLYSQGRTGEKLALLRRYHVRYAFYGDLERQMQADDKLPVADPFQGILRPVAHFSGSVLYEVP